MSTRRPTFAAAQANATPQAQQQVQPTKETAAPTVTATATNKAAPDATTGGTKRKLADTNTGKENPPTRSPTQSPSSGGSFVPIPFTAEPDAQRPRIAATRPAPVPAAVAASASSVASLECTEPDSTVAEAVALAPVPRTTGAQIEQQLAELASEQQSLLDDDPARWSSAAASYRALIAELQGQLQAELDTNITLEADLERAIAAASEWQQRAEKAANNAAQMGIMYACALQDRGMPPPTGAAAAASQRPTWHMQSSPVAEAAVAAASSAAAAAAATAAAAAPSGADDSTSGVTSAAHLEQVSCSNDAASVPPIPSFPSAVAASSAGSSWAAQSHAFRLEIESLRAHLLPAVQFNAEQRETLAAAQHRVDTWRTRAEEEENRNAQLALLLRCMQQEDTNAERERRKAEDQ